MKRNTVFINSQIQRFLHLNVCQIWVCLIIDSVSKFIWQHLSLSYCPKMMARLATDGILDF